MASTPNTEGWDPSETRCRLVTEAIGTDPVGTAGSYDVFVLFAHPLPWPHDAADIAALAPVLRSMQALRKNGTTCRLQLVVPIEDEPPVIFYRLRSDGPGYERVEIASPGPDDLARLAEEAARALPAVADASVPARPEAVADVLVCTHGRRDACCGNAGTRLWQDATDAGLGPGVRLWRTSHTGGHRFAPTLATFPDGRLWAWMDLDLLQGMVARSLQPSQLERHYRGNAALPSPATQALEREAFMDVGWDWLDYTVCGEEGDDADGGTRARIEYRTPTGATGTYEGSVAIGRVVPVPECGRPLGEAVKSQPELVVSRMVALPGG